MSKHLSKIAGFVCLVAVLSGCALFNKPPVPEDIPDDPFTQTKPEHAVILLFEAIKTADLELLKEAVAYPEDAVSEDTVDAAREAAKSALAKTAIKKLFAGLEYSIAESEPLKEGEDAAILTVEVTYPDLRPVIESSFKAYAPKVAERLMRGGLSEADIAAMQSEIMWAVAADLIAGKLADTRTETIEVVTVRTDDKWRVAPDRPILNVITANALETISGLDFSQLMAP